MEWHPLPAWRGRTVAEVEDELHPFGIRMRDSFGEAIYKHDPGTGWTVKQIGSLAVFDNGIISVVPHERRAPLSTPPVRRHLAEPHRRHPDRSP